MHSKFMSGFSGKKGIKNLVLSIVILVELIALIGVATFAWVETVSSIKIMTRNNEELEIDTYVYTEAMIGENSGTIDIAKYFKQGGDMHFTPASSGDGTTFFFPKIDQTNSQGTAYIANGASSFRQGNTNDKNTTYLSVSFKIKVGVDADFYFDQAPTFSAQGANMRVSITSQSFGSSDEPETAIYKLGTGGSEEVVISTDGGTDSVDVESFSDHVKGGANSTKLFSVGSGETKIVTVRVWLQGSTFDSTLPQNITITNLSLTSSITPRRVTLLPTSRWHPETEETDGYYYAWCWMSNDDSNSKLYKLSLDKHGHYSFEYNGSYDSALFFKSTYDTLTTENMSSNWGKVTHKSADTAIPATPNDPTFAIDAESNDHLYTGSWANPDVVTIRTAYVTGQNSTYGSINAASYIGTTVADDKVIEAAVTNASTSPHYNTVHAFAGKKVKLTATPVNTNNSKYRFVGWYSNAAGTGTALSTSAEYSFDASSDAPTEITYYAKFQKVYDVKIVKVLDGVQTTTSTAVGVGTLTIGSSTSGANVKEYVVSVDEGATVSLSAAASSGYTLSGIYTVSSGGTPVSSVTVNSNSIVTYYARFTTNSYNVTAHAYYSADYGSTYTADDSTGGTVAAGSAAAGATSTESVAYKSTVNLVASPASEYEFVGWYSGTASNATRLSTNTTYTYTLNSAANSNVYARFIRRGNTIIYVAPREDWGNDYYIRLYQNTSDNVISSNNGFVKADYDGATGYYKAVFSTIKTGNFKAILAKDTNHTDKVPSSGGGTGTLGNNYLFTKDLSSDGTALTAFSNQRCIWFIITESWLSNNLKNDRDYMQVYVNSADTNMWRINDNAYVVELSSPSGSIYFKQNKSDNSKRNEWSTTVSTTESQYKETSYNNGDWQ